MADLIAEMQAAMDVPCPDWHGWAKIRAVLDHDTFRTHNLLTDQGCPGDHTFTVRQRLHAWHAFPTEGH